MHIEMRVSCIKVTYTHIIIGDGRYRMMKWEKKILTTDDAYMKKYFFLCFCEIKLGSIITFLALHGDGAAAAALHTSLRHKVRLFMSQKN